MKAQLLLLGVLIGSTAFATVPSKTHAFKFPLSTLERCPKTVKGEFLTLERKSFYQNTRILLTGPAQIQPIPLARPLESKICPIPLAK